MNIYGSTGLGAAGTGETSHGIVPGKAWSPEVLAALQQMLASGSASPQPVAPAATAPQGGTMTPMAAYIGTGAPGASPMSMSGGQTAQQQGQQPGQMVGAPNNSALFMQFMQALQNLQGKRSG